MDYFSIKDVFRLKTRNKLIIVGNIKSDSKFKNHKINSILIKDIMVPINIVNETIIEKESYLALAFDIDCLTESLLAEIMKLKQEEIIKIFETDK